MSGILLYQIFLYRVSTVYFCYIMFLHVYTMQPDLPSVLNETMDLVFNVCIMMYLYMYIIITLSLNKVMMKQLSLLDEYFH